LEPSDDVTDTVSVWLCVSGLTIDTPVNSLERSKIGNRHCRVKTSTKDIVDLPRRIHSAKHQPAQPGSWRTRREARHRFDAGHRIRFGQTRHHDSFAEFSEHDSSCGSWP